MKIIKSMGAAALLASSVGASASMVNIDFEGLASQTAVTSINYGTETLSISNVTKVVGSGNAASEAWVYDTTTAGEDPDLTASFANSSGGSLSPGNVLIVQEDLNRAADDNGQGGFMRFDFSSSIVLQSIDVFDVRQGAVTFSLYNSLNALLVAVTNSENSDTGNSTTNNKYETVGFGGVEMSWMTVQLADSGALDNIRFDLGGSTTNISPVPLPGAVWLFGTALAGFVGVRRRRANAV